MVRSLGWGDFTLSNPNNPDGGLLQLIKDVAAIKQTKNNNSSIAPGKIDLVIGSDTFYNPPDFESLLSTVSFIINRHNTDCIFLTTYQNRSAKRNIDHLLEKWGLEGRVIERETFNFDHNKFVVNNNASDDNMDIKKSENETLMNMLEKEYESKKGTNWQSRIGKSKIESTKTLSPVEVSKNPSIALVDYSSGSDSEESEEETEVSIRIENRLIPEPIEESAEISNNDLSCSYKIGDGGSLSSVHLLLICKRGRGDITFEAWSRDHPHRSY
ncbi:hypothetical protein FBU30_002850 [Linnemannia zychae]|nr:hypothetical protein FBU30_002850 [Linnemannia zychae]